MRLSYACSRWPEPDSHLQWAQQPRRRINSSRLDAWLLEVPVCSSATRSVSRCTICGTTALRSSGTSLAVRQALRTPSTRSTLTHVISSPGDEMITRCAAVAKGQTKQTVTTEEKGLHRQSYCISRDGAHSPRPEVRAEFDIPGDTTGVLQSGIPFLNLHHYIGGTWVRPVSITLLSFC